jgi:hypothetical protein
MELGPIRTMKDAGLEFSFFSIDYAIWASPVNACLRSGDEFGHSLLRSYLESSRDLLSEAASILALDGLDCRIVDSHVTAPYDAAHHTTLWAIEGVREQIRHAPLRGRKEFISGGEDRIASLFVTLSNLESGDHARPLELENEVPGYLGSSPDGYDYVGCSWTFSAGSTYSGWTDALFAQSWEAEFYHHLLSAYGNLLVEASKAIADMKSKSEEAATVSGQILRVLAGDVVEVASEREADTFWAE